MKLGGGKQKGSRFERDICKQLSLWWSHNQTDDIFTRTASSGGRATQRSKKGKSTFGQYGDIQAADPIGQPLINLVTIECKDGYAKDTIAGIVDKTSRHHPMYEKFLEQITASWAASDSRYWWLIVRRRGRSIMIYMPTTFFRKIQDNVDSPRNIIPRIHLRTDIYRIIGFPLDRFLNIVDPSVLKCIWNDQQK